MTDSFTAGTIAFIMALPHEAKGVMRANGWYPIPWPGALAAFRCNKVGALTTFALSGAGRARALKTVEHVLQGTPPEAVISVGFAGGLEPGHRAGDLIIATRVRPVNAQGAVSTGPLPPEDLATRPPLMPDNGLLERVRRTIGGELAHTMGTLLTADAVVATPEEKHRLGTDYGAAAVDMESYWIAEACAAAEVPFLAVRAVVDDADFPVPPEALNLAMATGNDAWRLALWAATHPTHVPTLYRLGRLAKIAEQTIAVFILATIVERARAVQG